MLATYSCAIVSNPTGPKVYPSLTLHEIHYLWTGEISHIGMDHQYHNTLI